MPRPSLVTSNGPSPVLGFMAAIWLPFLVATPDGVVAYCCGPDARRFPVTGTERDFLHYPGYRFHHETQCLGRRVRTGTKLSSTWFRRVTAAVTRADRALPGR